MSRKIAREMAIKLLYQYDFHKEEIEEQMNIFISHVSEEKVHDDQPIKGIEANDIDFIKSTVNGTLSNLETIDKRIEETAKGWSVNRIAKVDLAILRLAVFEMFYCEDIPKEVSINEAVELAKKYSTEESRVFINGVLGKVIE